MAIRTRIAVCLAGLLCMAGCGGPDVDTQVWRFRTGYPVAAAPVYADGRIYAGSDRFYCLDAESGALLWDFTPYGVIRAPAVVDRGRVYLQCGGLYCLDALSGRLLWEFWVEEWGDGTPVILDGQVYFAAEKTLVCLSAESGKKIWQAPGISHPIAVSADGARVYVGGRGILAGFDARSGRKIWEHTNRLGRMLPVAHRGNVYLGSWDGTIACLDGRSGAVVWSREMPYPVMAPMAAFEDRVYVFSGSIYALTADTGETVMEKDVGVMVGLSPPYQAEDGSIFVVGSGGRLFALTPATGGVRGPWNVPPGRFSIARGRYYGRSGYAIMRLNLRGLSE